MAIYYYDFKEHRQDCREQALLSCGFEFLKRTLLIPPFDCLRTLVDLFRQLFAFLDDFSESCRRSKWAFSTISFYLASPFYLLLQAWCTVDSL